MKQLAVLALLAASVMLAGCGSMEPADGRPLYELKPHEVPEAVAKPEPILAAGNFSPYRVNGKTYRVMDSARGYREEGLASWYGSKFHGRLTSNGETFNAYGATAAHRSLPIPSYVRVTNLENGNSMILRVNDRGPFHADRIIDLSYAAAVRLGFEKKGTARVEVVALEVQGSEDLRKTAVNRSGLLGEGEQRYRYLQVGAFSDRAKADALSSRLRVETHAPVRVTEIILGDQPYYRVRIGPVEERQRLVELHRQLQQLGYLETRMMPE